MQSHFMLAVVVYNQGREAATFGPVEKNFFFKKKHATSLTTPFSEQLKLWSPSFQLIPRANKFHPNHLLPVWNTDRLSQRLI